MVDAFRFFPGAVDETGSMPFYAEECASMLAVTFSGGDKMMRSIVSTMQGICLAPMLCWPHLATRLEQPSAGKGRRSVPSDCYASALGR